MSLTVPQSPGNLELLLFPSTGLRLSTISVIGLTVTTLTIPKSTKASTIAQHPMTASPVGGSSRYPPPELKNRTWTSGLGSMIKSTCAICKGGMNSLAQILRLCKEVGRYMGEGQGETRGVKSRSFGRSRGLSDTRRDGMSIKQGNIRKINLRSSSILATMFGRDGESLGLPVFTVLLSRVHVRI
jgi:hypothetical protein